MCLSYWHDVNKKLKLQLTETWIFPRITSKILEQIKLIWRHKDRFAKQIQPSNAHIPLPRRELWGSKGSSSPQHMDGLSTVLSWGRNQASSHSPDLFILPCKAFSCFLAESLSIYFLSFLPFNVLHPMKGLGEWKINSSKGTPFVEVWVWPHIGQHIFGHVARGADERGFFFLWHKLMPSQDTVHLHSMSHLLRETLPLLLSMFWMAKIDLHCVCNSSLRCRWRDAVILRSCCWASPKQGTSCSCSLLQSCHADVALWVSSSDSHRGFLISWKEKSCFHGTAHSSGRPLASFWPPSTALGAVTQVLRASLHQRVLCRSAPTGINIPAPWERKCLLWLRRRPELGNTRLIPASFASWALVLGLFHHFTMFLSPAIKWEETYFFPLLSLAPPVS